LTRARPPSLGPVLFTVASAHLLAMEAHESQVDEDGGDYYLHRLVPVAEAARPYGALAEMAAVLHRVIEDTRDHPDVTRRYDVDRLRALEVPEEVVRAIDAVTRRPGEPYISGLIHRAAAHPLGRLVKLADNKHNLAANAALARCDPEKARTLREGRYRPARRILLAAEAADLVHGRRILA
jgi:(p)ppGpp synthase/HD superfamily hydrolase